MRTSYRIIYIDETEIERAVCTQMLAQRLYTVTLCHMMAGSEIMNPRFAREMRGALGYFTTDIGIDTGVGGDIDVILRRTGAPGHGAYHCGAAGDMQRHASETPGDMLRELLGHAWHGRTPMQHQIGARRGEHAIGPQAEHPRQLRIVAELGMRIEWQVIGKERDAMLQQQAQTALLDAAHALQSHGVHRFPRKRMPDLRSEQKREEERRLHGEQLFNDLWRTVPKGKRKAGKDEDARRRALLGLPEENLLYFLEKTAPRLAGWQREILRIVRLINQYFYPQRQTKVMNEGCATYTHHRVMNRLHEKGQIDDGAFLEFIHSHTSVVMQPDFDDRRYSGLNPYALGFAMLRYRARGASSDGRRPRVVSRYRRLRRRWRSAARHLGQFPR